MYRQWCCYFICGLVLIGNAHGDEQAEAKAVLEKAVKAIGGEAKLVKLKTGGAKGKITAQVGGQDLSLTFDGLWRGLDQYRLDVDVTIGGQNMKALLVVNGDKAWAKHNDRVEDAPAEVATIVKNSLYALRMPLLLPELKAPAYKLSHTGEVKVGDLAAVGLLVTHKDFKDVNLYFDKDNGLPLKSEISLTDPNGKEISIEYLYDDFKDQGGVKQPGKITVKAEGMEFTIELEPIKAEEKLDDNVFAKP